MFDKKKLNYWRLVTIFLGMTVITLLSLWISPQGTKASMMNESMSEMAKMHLSDATIYDLISTHENETRTAETEGTKKGIETETVEPSEVKSMGIISTLIVFGLLPLLICGSVILAIIWIK